MKIIDCFLFFNELELLEFRLKLLNEKVDYFLIVESNITFSGKPKPYYFEENKKLFKPWLHKIIYVPIKQSTKGLDFSANITSYTPDSASWKMEYEQRNALLAAANHAADDDMILLGDIDEIPNPKLLHKIHVINEPVALSMLFHYYFLNCQNIDIKK